jgi:ApaG protein
VIVRVRPHFLEDESSPEDDRYIWAYQIEIINQSNRTWQLVTRHWRITDCEGRLQKVDGEGVVGQTPVIEPGGKFEYSSGAPLSAPSGVMGGMFRLRDPDGDMLDAAIPLFALDSPYDLRSPN